MSQHDDFVRTLLGVGCGLVGLAAAASCGGLATCWFGGGAFVRFGIGTDLEDYRSYVRTSDLPDAERQEVLTRLDQLGAEIASGDLVVPFVVWVSIDDRIEGILIDGHVPPDELAELHEQLNRIASYE